MIKSLLSPNKSQSNTQNVKVQLKKPTQPQQETDKFILPSQNKAFQQSITNKKYNRYSDFDPNAGKQPQSQQPNIYNNNQPPNPYAAPFQQQQIQQPLQQQMYPPNPYLPPMQQPIAPISQPITKQPANNNNNNNNTFTMNANAVEFVPSFGPPITSPMANMNMNVPSPMNNGAPNPYPVTPTKQPPGFNPYLTAQNAHTVNPHALSRDFKQTPDKSPSKFQAHDELINNPESFNEDDYEIWEDENGEIIVVEKDQLYGDDPYYHDQKILKEYNKQRQLNGNNNTNMTQKGIRSGGQTYVYGANPNFDANRNGTSNNNNNYDEKQNDDNYPSISTSSPSNRRKRRNAKKNGSGYASAAAKFGHVYPSKGKVESFDTHSNPDYDPNAKICRFWLNGRCAYSENCKMAHRFETNSCPHCDKNVGKSPLIQQQV